jgi:hypothetical protein
MIFVAAMAGTVGTSAVPELAGETAAQGDREEQPGPWPLNVPAATAPCPRE